MSTGKGYHTKKWAGLDVFECDSCAVDSEFEDLIQSHVAAIHPEDKPEAPPKKGDEDE